MGDSIRAAIIGTGFMGGVHARSIARAGGQVRRVLGSSPIRSREAMTDLGAEGFATSIDDLLDDDEIDVVHVCTPNSTHAALVRATLAAGKHVVCEKPLASGLAEAEELNALASAAGVVTAIPFVYRFYPLVREARSRVADGTSGRVRLFHGSYLQDWLADAADDNWRVDAEAGGSSRAFADIGVHWCDLLEFVTGHRISRLAARTAIAVPERGGAVVLTEDVAALTFETDLGAVGNVTISQVSHGRKNRLWFSVDAERESLGFDQESPDRLWVGGRDVNQELMRGVARPGAPSDYSVLPPGHPQGYQHCFDAFVADTYRAIDGETPDGLPSFGDGLRAARITAAVLDAAAIDTWVDVEH